MSPACDETPRWLALHRDPALSLACNQLLIAADQAPAFSDAVALAAALSSLHAQEQARIDAACDEARARGMALGLDEGRAQALAEAAPRLAAWLQQIDEQSARDQQALRDASVPLALLVLRKTLCGLARDEVLTALLEQALTEVLGDAAGGRGSTAAIAAPITVRLHPTLLPAVRAAIGDSAGRLDWRADDSLAALDCVLETAGGRVLAGLETQLARIQAALQQPPLPTSTPRVSA